MEKFSNWEERKEALRQIVETYGYNAQSRQMIEEMAELTMAINKFWRHSLDCGRITLEDVKKDMPPEECADIAEELADVQIMAWQLEAALDCEKAVMEQIDNKLERQLTRLVQHQDRDEESLVYALKRLEEQKREGMAKRLSNYDPYLNTICTAAVKQMHRELKERREKGWDSTR